MHLKVESRVNRIINGSSYYMLQYQTMVKNRKFEVFTVKLCVHLCSSVCLLYYVSKHIFYYLHAYFYKQVLYNHESTHTCKDLRKC